MATAKEDAHRVLETLPDASSLEDIQYHLYVLQKVRSAQEAVARGEVLTQEEVEERMSRWLAR